MLFVCIAGYFLNFSFNYSVTILEIKGNGERFEGRRSFDNSDDGNCITHLACYTECDSGRRRKRVEDEEEDSEDDEEEEEEEDEASSAYSL